MFSWTNDDERRFLASKDEYAVFLRELFSGSSSGVVVVDVGANNGMFSIQCVQELPAGSCVYAFEPFSRPFACLSINAALSNDDSTTSTRIEPVRAAVAEVVGELDGTYLPNYSLLSGFHVSAIDKALLEGLAGRTLDEEFAAIRERVPCVRLDDWMSGVGVDRVHLLKVDTEKSELGVLRSLGSRVGDVDAVLVEVHEETKDGVLEFLTLAGFTIVSVSDPAPPTFCLRGRSFSAGFDARLNTYLVWARRPSTQKEPSGW